MNSKADFSFAIYCCYSYWLLSPIPTTYHTSSALTLSSAEDKSLTNDESLSINE